MSRVLCSTFLAILLASCSSSSSSSSDDGTPSDDQVIDDPPSPDSLADPDDDGLPDYLELILGSNHKDPHSPYRYGHFDLDNVWGPSFDGIPDGLERYLIDNGSAEPVLVRSETDGDGIPDYFEVRFASGAFDIDDPVVSGGDDVDDSTGPSGDGISDALEAILISLGATAPVDQRTSTDGDWAPDYVEVFAGTDPFDERSTPAASDDDDLDGLPNYLEILEGTIPYDPDHPYVDGAGDRDGDSLPNGLEDFIAERGGYEQDEVDFTTETDGDGLPDIFEVRTSLSALDDSSDPYEAGHEDGDMDGIANGLEQYLADLSGDSGLDIFVDTDLDGDGLPAVLEVVLAMGGVDDVDRPVRAGDRDDDADDASNALEYYLETLEGSPPIVRPITGQSDSDCDGRPDAQEISAGYDPQKIDLERYDDQVLPNVIRFDCHGQFEDNEEVRYVALRALSTQDPGAADFVNFHELRFRDTLGRMIPVAGMRIYEVTPVPDGGPLVDLPMVDVLLREHNADRLFDGIGLDDRDPDPTQWTVADNPEGEGMFTALDRAPYAYVIVDLGGEYDLQDMLIWNGLQSKGRAIDELSIELLSSSLDFEMVGAPGGYEYADAVEFWVRSDQGTSTQWDGDMVDQWRDMSGKGRHANAAFGFQPRFRSSSIAGGRPMVEFSGDAMDLPRPVQDDFTIYVIAATTEEQSGNWWQTRGAVFGAHATPCNRNMGIGWSATQPFWAECTKVTRSDDPANDGLPHILTATRSLSTTDVQLIVDGVTEAEGNSEAEPLDGSEIWGLGHVRLGEGFVGEVWEVIAFSEILNGTERRILDAALSAKYALKAGEGLFDHGQDYGLEVAGLGRLGPDSEVRRARAKDWIEISSPSSLGDGDFLMWGTRGVDPYATSYDAPTGWDRRLRQVWVYQETDGGGKDGVGTVDVTFWTDRFDPHPERSEWALLIDGDGRFDRSDRTILIPEINAEAKSVTFRDVDLGAGGFIALAVRGL